MNMFIKKMNYRTIFNRSLEFEFMKKYNNILIIFSLLVMGLFFYYLNSYVPLRSDDFYYQYKYLKTNVYNLPQPIDPTSKINSFSDIIESQLNHYQSMNGRFFVHTIVQYFCSIGGKPLYNIFASVVFILYLFIVDRLVGLSNKSVIYYWIITFALFWFSIPYPATISSCISFGLNYLLVPCLCLLFIFVYKTDLFYNKGIYNLFLIIFCIICGSLHEGFTIGISGYLFLDLVLNFKTLSLRKK